MLTENATPSVAMDQRYKQVAFSGFPLSDTRRRLRRFFNARGMAGKGMGGVDILCVGDSKTDGANTSTVLYGGYHHRLKLKLQTALNPVGVQGGYGYLRSTIASYTASAWAAANTLGQYVCTKEADVGLNAGWWVGFTTAAYNAANPRARYEFDGTVSDAVYKRSGITSVDYLLSNSCLTRFDMNTTPGAFITRGSGTNTASVAANGATGYRGAAKLAGATLAPTANNVVQWAPDAAAVSGSVFLHGLLAFNNDEDCGVRVHNLSYGGKKASDLDGDGNALALIYSFMTATSSATATYARNAKLVILNLGFNDFYFGGSQAAHYASLLSLVNKFLSQPSAPAILLYLHPNVDPSVACSPTTNYATMAAAWADFRDNVYGVAQTNDNIAVFDMWSTLGNAAANDTGSLPGANTLGYLNPLDLFHDTDQYNEAVAQNIAAVLTAA